MTAQNLFAYTAVNANYSEGTAGAINGERNAAAANLTAVPNKIQSLNGDPAFFNYMDRRESRLVLRQYTYSTQNLLPNRIIDPQGNWANPLQQATWNGVANLHGVTTSGNWLFATGYDLSKIAVVNMNTNYTQVQQYTFPTSFNISPYTNATYHGEALVAVGNTLYALFYVNQGTGYQTYYDSIVAKFTINTTTGALTYNSHVTVGKNSFTLDLYGNKLYVCSLGGMQQGSSGNASTNLCIVDLANFTQANVTTVTISNPTQDGDFRDISLLNNNNVYIFIGHYVNSFATMSGRIYHTTLANITTPANWTQIDTVNSAGYLWGIHADNYRLWFVKGTPIAVYNGTPNTAVSPNKTFSIGNMSDYNDGHLNSACFIAPSITAAARGAEGAVSFKSLAAHIRLAREARELAEKKKEEK